METKVLAKYLGGSHLYGLNTPESDIDERVIFQNTNPAFILGTKRFDQEVRQNEKEDVHKTEIRKFLELARKGNTTTAEVLFAPENKFEVLSTEMKTLRENRKRLIDSDILFKVISSFIHAQKFLIFDDKRKAEEGSKRDTKIKQYGYNPKAASTAIRLAVSGIVFFNTGIYQVKIEKESTPGQIKFHPENFTPEQIRAEVESYDVHLYETYNASEIKTVYDENFANSFLLDVYRPYLVN